MKIRSLLSTILTSRHNSRIDEKTLYGAYKSKSGDTVYEEFSLNKDHTFSSWIHQKPSSHGSWSLEGNMIHIKESSTDNDINIKVIETKNNQATFKFDSLEDATEFECV